MDMQGLSAICAGLGDVKEDNNGNRVGYKKGQYCLDNLKDLLRFLRRDDPQSRQVFKQVCKWNTSSKDLIPIIEHCQDDRNLVLNAVKVLVFLTMPIEPVSSDIPQQIEYLWGLKSAVTLSDTVAVIVSLLESSLENLESEAFTEEDWKLVQLVLTLFRNLLAVQDISPHQKAAGSACQMLSLRDKFMELLFRENVMDLILVIAPHVGESHSYLRQDNLLLLEIFHYAFLGQDPELVATARLKGLKGHGDTKSSLSSLRSIINEEKDKRRSSRLHTSSRHSQFSGTFARFTMDGNKAIIKGNPTPGPCESFLKSDKISWRSTKKIVWDHGAVPLVTANILELLHDFVNQFLSGGYNVLMQSIREDIDREHLQVQKSDIVNFFKLAKFVTSFQYHKSLASKSNTGVDSSTSYSSNSEDSTNFKGNICGPIAASMNESMFLQVISRWRDAFDSLKETKDYEFLAASGSLLKAMVKMLNLVLKLQPENSREPQTARILLYKLFYDQTDQGMTQFLLNLIKSFDEHKQPRSNLADLVEMVYMIVRLMERLQDRGTLRVSKKSRKSRKRKLSDKIETEKKAATLGEHAAQQRERAISNDEHSANDKEGTLHENLNSEGGTSMLPEAGVPDKPDTSAAELEKHEGGQLQTGKSEFLNDFGAETSDSSEDEQSIACNEVDFHVSTLVSAFANNSIIHNLCWLLKFYKSNSADTNHHLISILRKISDDLELSPMLYQLSLLTIFHEILVEQKSHSSKDYASIVDFLTDLVRRMLRKLKNQPLLFVELLFSKTRRECHHINAENLLHEVGNLKKQIGKDERVLNGETRPMHSAGWVQRSMADALGDDEADVVISYNLGPQTNEMHSDESPEIAIVSDGDIDSGSRDPGHESERVHKKRKRLVLNSDLETKIRDLYDKFKDDQRCSQLIAEALDSDGKVSSAQVMNKLKQLGLKVTGKKRMRSPSSGRKKPLEEGNAEETENGSLNSDNLAEASKRHPSHTRKRISALSEDQEARIRTLFEEFKDHKRCSYMIAKALDGDNGTFTTAQISRKLKQLGLQVPRREKTGDGLHLRDKNLSDSDSDNQDSDNETLLSLRLRGKSLENKESQNQNLGGNDDSDEELLSSIFQRSQAFPKKPKKAKKSNNEELTASSSGRGQIDESSGDVITEDVIERDGSNQPSDLEIECTEQAIGLRDVINSGGNNEVQMTDRIATGRPESPIEPIGASSSQQLEDELDDSDDDLSLDASAAQVSINRRRLRVVFDANDED
ncbi:hypothetical protein CDL15_Pgr023022 [Punica granatum]|uniref:Timeless N-terminal domain-containing protein n=1 Tax=Punica granatum TaxID=22663 RepID=A0A218X4N5_PUNGR|nr:hypothetical protein CDL15_Pgr023022 [Punica granatum]